MSGPQNAVSKLSATRASQRGLIPGTRILLRPNGLRISGERGGEADERVRCMRVLGDGILCLSRLPPGDQFSSNLVIAE